MRLEEMKAKRIMAAQGRKFEANEDREDKAPFPILG